MTLGQPDGVGAGLARLACGAEGVAAPVLLGAAPAAKWTEGLAQPASPAVRAVRTISQPRLPVIGPPPSPFPREALRHPKPVGPGGALASLGRSTRRARACRIEPCPGSGRSIRMPRRAAASVPAVLRSRTSSGAILMIAEVLPPPAVHNPPRSWKPSGCPVP